MALLIRRCQNRRFRLPQWALVVATSRSDGLSTTLSGNLEARRLQMQLEQVRRRKEHLGANRDQLVRERLAALLQAVEH